jgi:3-phosphoshikimate 1-carboxyvinyltransferase
LSRLKDFQVTTMKIRAQKSTLAGVVEIPASKSHTIRALVIATLADGVSEIIAPLDSWDTMSCLKACRALGARIEMGGDWKVTGCSGHLQAPEGVIDVGNSGTTLYIILSTAALVNGETRLTGDEQIQKRSAGELIRALSALGADIRSERGNDCAPLTVRGPIKGGTCSVEGITSQYVSSLLINCPLAENDTEITVTNLNEQPYVQMTMDWLDYENIRYEHKDMEYFRIAGSQTYAPFKRRIPADFSSATFFLVAGAISGESLTLKGLDMNDSQGDKAVVDYLRRMGAHIDVEEDAITVRGGDIRGCTLDLNATPDALPAMAVAACFAQGETALTNVPQARYKETDRIQTMASELAKMGASVKELPDGLVIKGGTLTGASLEGYGDHRVVMALAVAGLAAGGETIIDTAESVQVTFPNFVELMQGAGADMEYKR